MLADVKEDYEEGLAHKISGDQREEAGSAWDSFSGKASEI